MLADQLAARFAAGPPRDSQRFIMWVASIDATATMTLNSETGRLVVNFIDGSRLWINADDSTRVIQGDKSQ